MSDEWKLPLIIGCSVGGFFLILAVFIVVTYLCCRSHKRKKRCYENNLRNGDAATDNAYTTFSLQKPGMPPLPSSSGQSHLHGGLWPTQAVAPAQQWTEPIASVEVKSPSDKKASASTDVLSKQATGFWGHRNSQMHDSMESVNGFNSESFGSQSELIVREKKQDDRNKNRDSKKNQRKSELPEPDMSVIEEEASSKIGHHKAVPSHCTAEVPQRPVVRISRHHSEDPAHRSAAAVEVDHRRTVCPPSASEPPDSAAVNVDAVIEIQPKSPVTRTLTNTSEDKRMVLEAFSFLDEFEN